MTISRENVEAGYRRVIDPLVVLVLFLGGCAFTQEQPGTVRSSREPTSTQPSTVGPGISPPNYFFPVKDCGFNYGRVHHDYPATDIFTGRDCAFVAVTDGRVDEVSSVDRWDPRTDRGEDRGGLSVSILGDDGVRYYGSHLKVIASGITPGKVVRAGELLGRVDNSGDARNTPTHVHFGISWPTRPGVWWIRRGEVPPWPYLDSWQSNGRASPAAEIFITRLRLGVEPACLAEC